MSLSLIYSVMRVTGYRGDLDPASTADMWMRFRPGDSGRVDEMEVWKLVGLLSDARINSVIMLAESLGIVLDKKLYERYLCGGLMTCQDNQADIAIGGVMGKLGDSKFSCSFSESRECIVYILPNALIYDMDDRAMLFGIIHHELRHYMDYLDNDRNLIPPDYYVDKGGGDYEVDVAAYSRNITEMRAHADQAIVLIRIMGGAKNAKAAINRSQLGGGLLQDAMMAFIDALEAESRSRSLGENFDPPAVVRQAEDHDVRKLVFHLGKMCELMKFSNNVRRR